MADIDNMRGDTLRVVEENTLDNMRGVTQRVISENSIDNTRGVTYRVYNVNGGSAPAHYVEKTVDANGKLLNSTNIINLNGVTDVGNYALQYAYSIMVFPSNTSVDLSSLTKITGVYACQYMFNGCTGITSVDLSGLTTVSGSSACQYMFNGCTGITSVDLSGLTTVSGNGACYYMFQGCSGITSVDLSGLTNVTSDSACYYMFQGCSGITSVDLSSLTTVSGSSACYYMFQGCSGITSVDLSGLTNVTSNSACYYMFQGCSGITSVDLSSLTTVSGSSACYSMFQGCSGITSVDLSSLTTVSGNGACQDMFSNCTNLKNIYLPKIQSPNLISRPSPVAFSAFQNSGLEVFDARNIRTVGNYGILDNILTNTLYLKSINLNSLEHIGKEGARALLWSPNTTTSSLSNIYFPMLTSFGSNPFYTNAFTGRTNLTIHFRKDAQATVAALPNYATLWGAGTGSSVVFDLAGTLTGADSNSYARSEKDSVYASETAGAAKTATAWSYNNTIYYTSGSAEPSVGDTIYSDSACTQAVTTISSIA